MPFDYLHFPENPFAIQQAQQELIAARNRNSMFPVIQQQAQTDLARSSVGLQSDQAKLAAEYKGRLDGVIAQATAGISDPNQRRMAGADAVTRAVNAGIVPPDYAASALGGANGDIDWNAISNQAVEGQGNTAELQAQFGSPQTQDIGGQQVTTVTKVGPEGATKDLVGGNASILNNTLTPGQKIARVPTINQQTGAPETVPVGSLYGATGEPNAQGGALPTGLPPGAEGAFNVSGAGNAQQALALQNLAGGVNNRKALLGNLQGALDSFQPGPQSDFWKGLGQLAQEYKVPIPGAPPADKTAAQEAFAKMATQLAQQQFQSLGGTGTDAKLDSAIHTSPSEFLSKAGNQEIIAMLKGNEDAVAAQNDAWQRWQQADPVRHGPQSFGNFQAQFNKIYDPRVFQAQYLSPQQRATMLKGMAPAEQTKFKAEYKKAVQLGWVQ